VTGPNAPRHVDAPRPMSRPRTPKARTAEAPHFPSLLADETAEADKALNATPFESGGVLGRREPAPTNAGPSPTIVHDGDTGSHALLATTPAGMPQAAEVDQGREQTRSATGRAVAINTNTAAGLHAYTEGKSSPGAVQPSAMPPTATRAVRATSLTSSPRATSRPPINKNSVNTIFVAIHAVEQGCAIYARVGRMNATEREQLRHSVSGLLAEYGLSAESINIDGVDAVTGVGGDQWPR
jgi:hypothetical protein